MFRQVSHLDWKQHGDVRLRVVRIPAIATAQREHDGRVSVDQALRPGAQRRFAAVPGWLRRILSPRQRRR
jgi:hypothetical protein